MRALRRLAQAAGSARSTSCPSPIVTSSRCSDRVIRLPVSWVTSCAFGGPELRDLYITTMHYGMSTEAKREQPLAGALFIVAQGCAAATAIVLEPRRPRRLRKLKDRACVGGRSVAEGICSINGVHRKGSPHLIGLREGQCPTR